MVYTTVEGDTFDAISRKVYGEQRGASRIRAANPGSSEPFRAGVELQIPPQQSTTPQAITGDNRNQVSIYIGENRFRFWSSVVITRGFDQIDTFSFTAPHEPDRPEFRNTFRPFSYQPVTIAVGGNPLFTGTMVSVNPRVDNTDRVVDVSGYSLPGVLWDCTVPASSLPIEWNDLKLDEIARKIVEPFGISVVFDADPGAVFKQVAALPEERVGMFLTKLAKQRNLVMGSSPAGELVFRQDTTDVSPVAVLTEGVQPLLSVSPVFNPQEYYSHITGMEPALVGLEGQRHTVTTGVQAIRPLNFSVIDSVDGAVVPAVNAKAARMYADAASYTIRLPGWRAPGGELWEPGQLVKLQAPGAMVYDPYVFMVRDVTLMRNDRSETTTMNLVIPGVFAGKRPEVFPWE